MVFSENKSCKKRIIAGIVAAVTVVTLISGIVWCFFKFNNDPYWQLLHSVSKLKNAESFSFTMKTTQTIRLDLPILSEQSVENEIVYNGDVCYNKNGSELLLLAESDKNTVLLYKNGNEWKTAHKENKKDAKWSETKTISFDYFDNDSVTEMGPEYSGMIAINGLKGFGLFKDAQKSYKYLTEYSSLELERTEDNEQISGAVRFSKLMELSHNSDKGKNNPVLSAIMIFLCGDSIKLDNIECSDGEICWNNSDNYPSDISLGCSFTFDASEVLTEMAKDTPELQNIIGFLGGFIETDAECDISADIQFFDYGKASVDTDDFEEIIS